MPSPRLWTAATLSCRFLLVPGVSFLRPCRCPIPTLKVTRASAPSTDVALRSSPTRTASTKSPNLLKDWRHHLWRRYVLLCVGPAVVKHEWNFEQTRSTSRYSMANLESINLDLEKLIICSVAQSRPCMLVSDSATSLAGNIQYWSKFLEGQGSK